MQKIYISPSFSFWMCRKEQCLNSVSLHIICCCLITQSCLTLGDPVVCGPPDSFVHGIPQARILEWVAFSSSRGSFWPRDRTRVSCIAGRFSTIWTTKEAISVQLSSVAQSCPTLCYPMNCSAPGLPVHQQLPEFTQTHVHWVGDAI